MSSLSSFIDQYNTAEVLRGLSDSQIEAIVKILTVSIYADGSAGFMEKMELEQLLLELPWTEGKGDKLEDFSRKARQRVELGTDPAELKPIVAEAAQLLTDTAVREKVFSMAATLAWADKDIKASESRVLLMIAEAFAISDDRVRTLIEGAK